MVKKLQEKQGRLYVLHLTPCENFVWNKLRENAKEVDGQWRIAIPADRDDLYLAWDPPKDLDCDENSLHRIVQRFCSAGVIARVGENGNGFVPHVLTDAASAFFVNKIETRQEHSASPEMIKLAKNIMEGGYAENGHLGFTVDFHDWISKTSTVKPSTAHVKLVGVRLTEPPAIGVLYRNPEWENVKSPGRRYLVAVPGFTAYELVPDTLRTRVVKRVSKSMPPEREDAAETASVEPAPDLFSDKDVNGMQRLIQSLEGDIAELKVMLDKKNHELASAIAAMKLKLEREMVIAENQLRRLKALRDNIPD